MQLLHACFLDRRSTAPYRFTRKSEIAVLSAEIFRRRSGLELPAIALALAPEIPCSDGNTTTMDRGSRLFCERADDGSEARRMLVEIELPSPKPHTGCCFMEIARRRGDFAIVGVAAMMTLGSR